MTFIFADLTIFDPEKLEGQVIKNGKLIWVQNGTLPETNSSPLKMDGWKMNFLLGRPIFRCDLLVSGRVLPKVVEKPQNSPSCNAAFLAFLVFVASMLAASHRTTIFTSLVLAMMLHQFGPSSQSLTTGSLAIFLEDKDHPRTRKWSITMVSKSPK